MKRAFGLIAAILLLTNLLCTFPASAAGSLSASASATSVSVGQSVTVTLKYSGGGSPIGGFIGYFKYDAKVFSYSSFKGEGIDASGGAGTVKFLYSAPGGTAPSEVSFTLTLKATAAGNGKFSVETDEFINDENYNSLGTPSKTLSVSAINPTKSANADLSALKPSSGTLTPKFSAKTTEYTITVPYTTTTLNLNATASHKEAKVGISGSNSLQVGKNTRVITVTAANGTTKKY
ncbi:MAG: cadherin-like beta sandwich domain-containing protein, partial [Clostridia bacterium]|nr:cadherin-like beta sandwich domain-containing protein [Clostridia bacterium]